MFGKFELNWLDMKILALSYYIIKLVVADSKMKISGDCWGLVKTGSHKMHLKFGQIIFDVNLWGREGSWAASMERGTS